MVVIDMLGLAPDKRAQAAGATATLSLEQQSKIVEVDAVLVSNSGLRMRSRANRIATALLKGVGFSAARVCWWRLLVTTSKLIEARLADGMAAAGSILHRVEIDSRFVLVAAPASLHRACAYLPAGAKVE